MIVSHQNPDPNSVPPTFNNDPLKYRTLKHTHTQRERKRERTARLENARQSYTKS